MKTLGRIVTYPLRQLAAIAKAVISTEKTDSGRARAVFWLCVLSLVGHWYLMVQPAPILQDRTLTLQMSQLVTQVAKLSNVDREFDVDQADLKDRMIEAENDVAKNKVAIEIETGLLWSAVSDLERRFKDIEQTNSHLRARVEELEDEQLADSEGEKRQELRFKELETKPIVHVFCDCDHSKPEVRVSVRLILPTPQSPLSFPVFGTHEADTFMNAVD